MKKLLTLILCLCLVVACFAGCGGNTDTTSSNGGNVVGTPSNDQYTDEKGELVNIGDSTKLAMTLEDIANISNPVIRGCESWPSEWINEWKEEELGLFYDFDQVDDGQRQAKYISAFVSGDAYDVYWLSHNDFPIVAQKGLVQAIDKILPVYDETLFFQDVTECFSWKGRVYGVNAWQGVDAYGVHYNQTLFDNAGEKSPKEYYEEGTWTFQNFYNLTKSLKTDDVYGLTAAFNRLVPSLIVANGASIFTTTDTGAEVTIGSAAGVEALNWAIKFMDEANNATNANEYKNGNAAMLVERYNQINGYRNSSPNYEFGWVPFPTGPSGTGEQTGSAYAWAICKGAKNVEGALAFITAECYMEQWHKDNGVEYPLMKRYKVEGDYEMYKAAEAAGRMDNTDGFGFNVYQLVMDAQTTGVPGAIEKHTPTMQARINQVLSTEQEDAKIDFEDQGVFNFNDTTDYPFVNVIGDDKFTYGTEEAQSLTIDLTGVTEFAPILHTKPELFKLQNGGQYKVTFKLYCADEVPAETFAIAARTTSALDGSPTFGLTWLEPKAGEAVDVQVFINVNENFTGDLAIVLLGSATEASPELQLVMDDFRVELVSDK